MAEPGERVFETMEDLLLGRALSEKDAARRRANGEVVTHFNTRYGVFSLVVQKKRGDGKGR